MTTKTSRTSRLFSIAIAGALALTACGTAESAGGSGGSGASGDGSSIIVGSAGFPENDLLAEIYAQALEAQGVKVTRKIPTGGREVYLKALDDGSIDLVPDYTGALMDYYTTKSGKKTDASSPDDVLKALTEILPDTLTLYEKSAAEDKDSMAVTKATAEKYDIDSLEDLAPIGKELIIGGTPQFETRYQGVVGLKEVYGITFKSYVALDTGGPLTINALVNGDVQIADIFSTQPELKIYDLVVLDDPKNLFVAQNIIPLITKSKGSPKIKAALDEVSAALTTEILTDMLAKITVDKADYDTVAEAFLKDNGLVE